MKSITLDEAIYERYIVPTKRKRTKLVGLEFELPIVNRKNEPVDFNVVHKVTDAFLRKFSFNKISRDDDGYIYTAINEETGDGISFDCSYNTLEFSFGTEKDINVLYHRFAKYYTCVQNLFHQYNHTLTGMGINPHHAVNKNIPVVSERYRMLLHHLSSYEKYGKEILFHNYPNFGLFSCASQIQMDVEESNLVETLNTFTKLEPLKVLVFANSLWGEKPEFLCSRDALWRNSLHSLTELLANDHVIYHKGYNASELRRMFVKKEIPNIFDKKELSGFIIRVLETAKTGLENRGFGEDKFLEPLYRRAEGLLSPAREMIEGLQAGKSMEDYIEEYGRL